MPFDAVFLTAVTQELASAIGSRVDKVQQPERDTVILQLRSGRLLLTASPNRPRIHFTAVPAENPAQPPMFCMLLRKHLVGGRLVSVTQPPMERLVDLCFDCTSELGEPVQKHLVLEIMGRNSNLILLGSDGRILDCLRRVDFEMSQQRQVLPGLFYHLPPAMDKRNPMETSADELDALLQAVDSPKKLDGWLLDSFGGLSPLLCRELAFLVLGNLDADVSQLSAAERSQAATRLFDAFSRLTPEHLQPVLLEKGGKPSDFYCMPIRQYGEFMTVSPAENYSALLDSFYGARDRDDRIRQKTQAIRKSLTNLHSRTARKLELQRKELAGTLDREQLRRLGDIVTSNIHAISRGQTRLKAVDFYDPEMQEIEIPLSPTLSPQQNAAKFYKDYQKAKTAEKILTEQIAKGEVELEYLSSILDELTRAESEKDIAEIRSELIDGGYLREQNQKKRMKLPPSQPMEFESSEGLRILVGRNNRQNDQLTTKLAGKTDLWLHTQKIHGSHVIIDCHGAAPGDQTVTEAAMLAAYYSQAREGQNVPVDYTAAKNVKKPAGAKPGMVIYDHYNTAYVTPDVELTKTLRRK